MSPSLDSMNRPADLGFGDPSRSFVSIKTRVCYFSVPKAACTSFKWLMADLSREDSHKLSRYASIEGSRSLAIHERGAWSRTPTFYDLRSASRNDALAGRDWFTFVIYREPSSRVWSAWQSKFLFRDSRYVRLFPEAAPPSPPRSIEEAHELFDRFVGELLSRPDRRLFEDEHFRPQSWLFPSIRQHEGVRVFTTAQISELMTELELHLSARAFPVPRLPVSNETPISLVPSLLSRQTVEILADLYSDDYSLASFEARSQSSKADLAEGFAALLTALWERNLRIDDLVSTKANWTQSVSRRINRVRSASLALRGGQW